MGVGRLVAAGLACVSATALSVVALVWATGDRRGDGLGVDSARAGGAPQSSAGSPWRETPADRGTPETSATSAADAGRADGAGPASMAALGGPQSTAGLPLPGLATDEVVAAKRQELRDRLFARIGAESSAAYLRSSAHRYTDTLDKVAAVHPTISVDAATKIIDAIIAGECEYLRIRDGAERRLADAVKRGGEEEAAREVEETNRQYREFDAVWPARTRDVIRSVLGEESFARFVALESGRPRGAVGSDPRR